MTKKTNGDFVYKNRTHTQKKQGDKNQFVCMD